MIKKITLLSFVILVSSVGLKAQTDCGTFHRKACEPPEDGEMMRYDSQSKSAIMAKGQTSEFHLVAYNKLDYRITVCADELLGDQIQFKVYEKDRVLVKPEEAMESAYEEEAVETESQDAYADDTYDEYSEDSYSDDSYSDDSYSEDSYSQDSYSDDSYGTAAGGGAYAMDDKPKFKVVKELLYDNASDSYAPYIEFTADGTMSLIIEIKAPGEAAKGKLKIMEKGCVGVLIEHAKSARTGF